MTLLRLWFTMVILCDAVGIVILDGLSPMFVLGGRATMSVLDNVDLDLGTMDRVPSPDRIATCDVLQSHCLKR
jgi:hypothetical protein